MRLLSRIFRRPKPSPLPPPFAGCTILGSLDQGTALRLGAWLVMYADGTLTLQYGGDKMRLTVKPQPSGKKASYVCRTDGDVLPMLVGVEAIEEVWWDTTGSPQIDPEGAADDQAAMLRLVPAFGADVKRRSVDMHLANHGAAAQLRE